MNKNYHPHLYISSQTICLDISVKYKHNLIMKYKSEIRSTNNQCSLQNIQRSLSNNNLQHIISLPLKRM